VHGFDRGTELSQAIQQNTAVIVERASRITGYTTALEFFGHTTAETNLDLEALIAAAQSFRGPGILVPSRNSALCAGVSRMVSGRPADDINEHRPL
jgi:hypothetical protein